MTRQPAPRVFISYSHDTVEHQERVLGLADRLRADGIDAEIDQYNDAPPEGWPRWCERQIEAADVVLMVCTETYHRRVRGEEVSGKGLGVVWEAATIRQLIYDAGTVSSKFVPVLFTDGLPDHIPTPIKGWSRYVVDSEEGYESLYRRLTGQPRLPRPPLGTIRPLPVKPRQWHFSDSGFIADGSKATPMSDENGGPTPIVAYIMILEVAGFSRLNERQVALYQRSVAPSIKSIIDSEVNPREICDINTWGDASVMLVVREPYQLARCSLHLRDFFKRCNWTHLGLPDGLICKIALAASRVAICYNVLRQQQGVLGPDVTAAAHAEHIVYKGCVWATQQFKTQLDPDIDPKLSFDALGEMVLSKRWGETQLYNVRWSSEPPLDYEAIKARTMPPYAEPQPGVWPTTPRRLSRYPEPSASLMTFDDPANVSGYYDDFYKELNLLLNASEHLAIVAGEGFDRFDLANKNTRAIAMTYARVLANCAARHQLIRFEFTPRESPTEWIDLLAKYVPFYDQGRQKGMLVYCPSPSVHLVRNMALVDPAGGQPGMILMFPRHTPIVGGNVVSRAAAAVLTRHMPAVYHAYMSIMELLKNPALYANIANPPELLGYYGRSSDVLAAAHDEATSIYFAFGSNMMPDLMAMRAPSAKKRGKAVLRGHKLVFGSPPVPLAGAVASVVKSPGDEVEGVLYDVNKFDLERLAFYEGVDQGFYDVEEVEVLEEGRGVKATTYIFAAAYPSGEPSPRYIASIVEGAKEGFLSERYIAALEDIQRERTGAH